MRSVDWETFPQHLARLLPIEQNDVMDEEQTVELRLKEFQAIRSRIEEMRRRMREENIPLTGWYVQFVAAGRKIDHLDGLDRDDLLRHLDRAREVLDRLITQIRQQFDMRLFRSNEGFASILSFCVRHPDAWDDSPGITLAFLLQQESVYRAKVLPDGPFTRSASIESPRPDTTSFDGEKKSSELQRFLGFDDLFGDPE